MFNIGFCINIMLIFGILKVLNGLKLDCLMYDL